MVGFVMEEERNLLVDKAVPETPKNQLHMDNAVKVFDGKLFVNISSNL